MPDQLSTPGGTIDSPAVWEVERCKPGCIPRLQQRPQLPTRVSREGEHRDGPASRNYDDPRFKAVRSAHDGSAATARPCASTFCELRCLVHGLSADFQAAAAARGPRPRLHRRLDLVLRSSSRAAPVAATVLWASLRDPAHHDAWQPLTVAARVEHGWRRTSTGGIAVLVQTHPLRQSATQKPHAQPTPPAPHTAQKFRRRLPHKAGGRKRPQLLVLCSGTFF